jgi:cation/acetate symporter
MITLAAPEITGLGSPLLGIVAAAVLAAFLVTAEAPLAAIVTAVCGETRPRSGLVACAVVASAVAAAAYVASTHPASILEVATWALMLAASALFPALVIGLWWPRASATAATFAVLAGLAVSLHYLLAARYLAPGFYETWEMLSSAGPTAREFYGELKNAWVEAAPGPAKDAAWAALDAHAQGIANWWGVERFAAVLLALPVGTLAMVLLSLVLPSRHAPETAS